MGQNRSRRTVGTDRKSPSTLVRARGIDELAQRLLQVETELNSNIPTTLWISDLHGEGDRFKSILRGRFGVLYQTCREALPNTFTADKVQYLVKIIRQQHYITDISIRMGTQDVILCLVQILKYKLTNARYNIDEILMPEFRDTISRLLSGLGVPNPIFEEEIISSSRIVDYVFGNHDILWMGAASGNRSLIAEAMRITFRYDHFEFLERLDFDISVLESFATATYPAERVTGNFKARTEKGRSMEKALAVIQFKLEEKTINEYADYQMNSRLWLDKLAHMLKNHQTEGLNDTYFPTIDFSDPRQLSKEEREVIDDLVSQFITNRKLKRLLGYLFSTGKTYSIYNDILNIHALVPSTSEGEFDEFLGRSGKHLLNFIQTTIERVGNNYLEGKPQDPRDQALFFYLWCGPKSPFFGKHAMKTFERYFLVDKATHVERSLYWLQNLENPQFKATLLNEFGVKRVVYGHTPIDYLKGKHMASDDGVAINVDGGFAAAYYNRGHSLVQTPYQLYGIILPTPDEIKEAEQKLESAPLDIELIDEFLHPKKVKDSQEGKKLKTERDRLMKKITMFEAEMA
ncbi:MAG: fructose-bisphosphatase class III [Desulfofustis sp.]